MTLSMYEASIPVFQRALTQLSAILGKGAAHAAAKKFDPAVLVNARLAPDMLPFSRQIQLTSDFAKNSMARLAGVDPPKFDDVETTMDELVARVKKTLDYIDSVEAAALEGSETRHIVIKLRDRTVEFPGLVFLQTWAIPNFFFHHVTSYNLLRHNGVDIGKRDFLGG